MLGGNDEKGATEALCCLAGSYAWDLLVTADNSIAGKLFQVLFERFATAHMVAHDITDSSSRQLLPTPSVEALQLQLPQYFEVENAGKAVQFVRSVEKLNNAKKSCGSIVISIRMDASKGSRFFHFIVLGQAKSTKGSVRAFRRRFLGNNMIGTPEQAAPPISTMLLDVFLPSGQVVVFLDTPLGKSRIQNKFTESDSRGNPSDNSISTQHSVPSKREVPSRWTTNTPMASEVDAISFLHPSPSPRRPLFQSPSECSFVDEVDEAQMLLQILKRRGAVARISKTPFCGVLEAFALLLGAPEGSGPEGLRTILGTPNIAEKAAALFSATPHDIPFHNRRRLRVLLPSLFDSKIVTKDSNPNFFTLAYNAVAACFKRSTNHPGKGMPSNSMVQEGRKEVSGGGTEGKVLPFEMGSVVVATEEELRRGRFADQSERRGKKGRNPNPPNGASIIHPPAAEAIPTIPISPENPSLVSRKGALQTEGRGFSKEDFGSMQARPPPLPFEMGSVVLADEVDLKRGRFVQGRGGMESGRYYGGDVVTGGGDVAGKVTPASEADLRSEVWRGLVEAAAGDLLSGADLLAVSLETLQGLLQRYGLEGKHAARAERYWAEANSTETI